MAVAALTPLLYPALTTAASSLGPFLAKYIGEKGVKTLSPLAEKGIKSILESGIIEKGFKKLGNKIFGKSKTARKLFNKGKKVINTSFSKENQENVKTGLGVLDSLNLITPESREKISSAYDTALKFHDKLSEVNKPNIS